MKTFSMFGVFFGIGVFIISFTPSTLSSADNSHWDTNDARIEQATEEALRIGVLANDDVVVSSFIYISFVLCYYRYIKCHCRECRCYCCQ